MPNIISVEVITSKIFEVRGKKVMLDSDLAKLYGVEAKYLIRQVKRNSTRFPDDFMYVLSLEEVRNLRCQNVTSSWGGRRYLPYAFTQEGVTMLSSVLNSDRAVQVNIQILRAFVKLRNILSTHKEFEVKLKELEKRIEEHDLDIHEIFEVIRRLMGIPETKKVIKGFAQK
ncbi:MAG: ORF6N domain-containing protein [Candidatus Omnitrophica bacterium]|nr:ORF6N domain-containing protein [Candidatus Omnitrophota bacterium]